MAESKEAKRSEDSRGAESDDGEIHSRHTQEVASERPSAKEEQGDAPKIPTPALSQHSSNEEGGGGGEKEAPASQSESRDSDAEWEHGTLSSFPLQVSGLGMADEELDGAPVIGADEEDDWDMDMSETLDSAMEMDQQMDTRTDKPADARTEVEKKGSPAEVEADAAKTATSGVGAGAVATPWDAQRPPLADVEMSVVAESAGPDGERQTQNSDASQGGGVPQLSGSGGSRRLSEETQEALCTSQELEMGDGERAPYSPPLDIKDEPIDEEYDRALLPHPPPRRIKDEPDAPEELVQQHKTSEMLRISSVFSVGESSASSAIAPRPASGGGQVARAMPVPPRTPQTVTPPAPASASRGGTPPGTVRVSCSGCTKVLQKGQTAFQRKGSSQLFCSTVCLTGCTLPATKSLPKKTCHACLKEIVNPKDLIIAPVDTAGNMKDFCSQGCLSDFKKNTTASMLPGEGVTIKCSMCRKTAIIRHEVNYQGAVHKLCSDTCFSRFRSSNNLTMNCCETCGNYCYSASGQCHLLQIEGTTRKFCSPVCLTTYKQKLTKVSPCAQCGTPRSSAEMVESTGADGKIHLYCSMGCAASATPRSGIAGASFPCTNCKVVAVPQFHLALNDGTIRNFCSYNCVLTFQASFTKTVPQGQMNGTSSIPEGPSVPPPGPFLPSQAPGTVPRASALPSLSAPPHGQALPHGHALPHTPAQTHGPGSGQTPPSPSTRGHGHALVAPPLISRGPVPAQAPPSLTQGPPMVPPGPLTRGLVKLTCKQCFHPFSSKPELIQFKGQMIQFCGKTCSEEFRKLNFVTARCEYCKLEKMVRDVIRFNRIDRPFCSEGCKLLFKHDLSKRSGTPCRSCAYCTNMSQKMIQNHFGGRLEEFCREECMSLYTVLYYQMAKCDWCQRQGKLLESQKWLGEVKHFCNLQCLLHFTSQQSSYDQPSAGQDSAYDQPTVGQKSSYDQPSAGQHASYDPLPSSGALPPQIPTGTVPACIAPPPIPVGALGNVGLTVPPYHPAYVSKEATPVIANVVSLASAPTGQPYITANMALQGAVPSAFSQTKINGDASTQTDAMKPPAAPRRVLKNKALLCKPISQNKGTLCKPHLQSTESQTEEQKDQKIMVLPVPVPVFIPVPMHLYTQYTPLPLGLPVPLPVPMFLPTSPASADSILRAVQDLRDSTPRDPQKGDRHITEEEEEEEEERDKPISFGDQGSTYSGDLESEGVSTPHSWEEESAASNQRLGPASDPEGPPSTPGTHTQLDLEADFPIESLQPTSTKELNVTLRNRGRRRPRDGFPPRKRGRKRGAAVVAAGVARSAMPPAGSSKLHHMYGVNAWRCWVQGMSGQSEQEQLKQGGRSVALKEDVLQCSSSELSFGLCRFIREVRRPNGEPYSPDSIFYLCLGLQQYLLENGRIENLFTDQLYSNFTLEITKMLRDWKPTILPSGYLPWRVEEEFLWACKQLGAYSPTVLLNTLLFFSTKLFHLKTLPQHRRLSFANLTRCTRQGTSTKSTYLRFCPAHRDPAATETPALPAKRRIEEDEEEGVLEMPENTDNPLRCPVRLYEFYLSKCPDEVKQRTDLFYLQPERSCMPNSRLWYSSQPLESAMLENMLTRILTVREVHLVGEQPVTPTFQSNEENSE
ncbi:zinc finger MYM-type protein 4-like isoform X2 [Megalops cyprinoides]|uniref:zinc finger MYM-type protein 4-like isoform X2 n=1 Tax=Megalops cyprinoides TaxID=118141 RepID=UPI001863A5A1|nr:zinc finger MYM-type protein 4-like isoform X2 [Megalops cyprinoides]